MGELIMFFDTETTGKSDFKAPYNSPVQPNLVQLGYRVQTPSREVIFEIGHLCDTTMFDSWKGIEPEAQALHGVSQEQIQTYGWPPESAIDMFSYWAGRCSLFVAHNEKFDTMIMQCFAHRQEFNPDLFNTGVKFCTMQHTTNICKIPQLSGRGGNKWPKLNEAYPFFHNGQQFKDAHNALADVNACADIFWKLADARLLPEAIQGGLPNAKH